MQEGRLVVDNEGLPVRVENTSVLQKAGEHYGYNVSFGEVAFQDEWIDFKAIKGLN